MYYPDYLINGSSFLQKQNKGLVMINFYKHYIDCAPTNATGNVSHVAGKGFS